MTALTAAVAQKPDVVLLDLGLPAVNGSDDYLIKPVTAAQLSARHRAAVYNLAG